MVNRIWHHHFGRGIVCHAEQLRTDGHASVASASCSTGWPPSLFAKDGASNDAPADPDLADLSDGIELLPPGELWRRIPTTSALWRFPMRRLEAEIIRDVVLSASGQINLQAGGPPFFPAVPKAAFVEVARVGKWMLTKEEPSTWRRSVYSYWKRARKSPDVRSVRSAGHDGDLRPAQQHDGSDAGAHAAQR